MRPPHEADIVERNRPLYREIHLEGRQVHRLEVAAEGALETYTQLVPLDGRQKPDRAEVDPEDRHPCLGETAQRVEDASVAAEHDADVRSLSIFDLLDPRGGVTVLLELVGSGDQLDRRGLGGLHYL